MTLLPGTWQFDELKRNTPGTLVLYGGTRSGKTFSIIQYWIDRLLKESGKLLSVARKYRESHRTAALRDFERIMRMMEIWQDSRMHKGDFTYDIGRSKIEFIGMDVEEKKMGAERSYLWVNEATELTQNEYRHLAMRTSGDTTIFDFNPKVDPRHWVKADIMERSGTVSWQSTYKDNPFLPASQIAEIERIREQDPLFWKVYGEGDFASLVGNIYTNWTTAPKLPGGSVFGVDFGMTDPTAIVEVAREGEKLYWKERLYQTGMTNSELIAWIKANEIKGRIYCDSAEPQRILEMQRAGLAAVGVPKERGSLRAGIDFCRRHKILLVDSPNIEREISQYRWRENRMGSIIDGEPVDFLNHALDAARYASHTHYANPPGQASYESAEKRAFSGQGAW